MRSNKSDLLIVFRTVTNTSLFPSRMLETKFDTNEPTNQMQCKRKQNAKKREIKCRRLSHMNETQMTISARPNNFRAQITLS